MHFLPVRQRDPGMLFQEIMECGGARLLCAGYDELQALDSSTLPSKHSGLTVRPASLDVHGRVPLTSGATTFCNQEDKRAVLDIMLLGLAKLRAGALVAVEFAIVLAVVLVLGATAIPGLVRIRRRG